MRRGDVAYVSWWCPDADRATRFYAGVLGWEVEDGDRHRRVTGQALPIGIQGGHETSTLFSCYATDDLTEALEAVRSAGGDVIDGDAYENTVVCTDGQGMTFALYEPSPDELRPAADGSGEAGDLAYVTHEVPDSARARTFFRAVLGWRFEPGRVRDGWGVVDTAPMTGLVGSTAAVGVPMWIVDDVAGAAERARDLGGSATEPERQPYGLQMSECTDDQGGRFYLGGP
jgi:predicted enzyme related to lactoylglutathione lyase